MGRDISKVNFFIRAIWSEMKDADTEALIILLVVTLTIGVGFYSFVENWNLIDALYFSVMTLTTVGYGDIVPKTEIGKLFTIGYILVGIVLMLGFVNTILKNTIERHNMNRYFREKSFYEEIDKFKDD